MSQPITRRQVLAGAATALGAAAIGACTPTPNAARKKETNSVDDSGLRDSFGYCFNTSTIRGQKLSLIDEIDVAAKAGYDAIEPWIKKIARYKESGGSLKDLARRCTDHGLKVASAIGFAQWIVDDPAKRARGIEQAKRDMDLVKQIGGTHLAAPPAGANRGKKLELFAVAERYHKLLEVGREIGVIPQVEVWGFSANLSRLGEAVFVAVEAGHPDACVLPDVYHIYKGGSDPNGLKLLGRQAIHCFHFNDYPADPPRETIKDSHRVYPGDGVAPLDRILGILAANHSRCMLSLELFNPGYWKHDALAVATTGLRKTRAAVRKALKARQRM